MSLNQSYAISSETSERFGTLFNTIDFTINDDTNVDVIKKSKYNDISAGEFHIDGRSFKVTLSELDRIAATANTAKETFLKKYQLGYFGK